MEIAILGCGNVGVAMAADLSLRGHSVTLVKTSQAMHNATFKLLEGKNPEIAVKEQGWYTFTHIREATADLSVISRPEVVIVTIQTTYHEPLIERIKGFLRTDQIVVFVPSYMASMYMRKHIGGEMPTIVEMTGTPTEGRIEEDMIPGTCVFRVGSRLRKNFISIFQPDRADETMRRLEALGYGFENRYSPLEAALLNPNMILHTAGSVLSIPRIEKSKGDFCMYREAYSRDNAAMMKIVERLDREKNHVLDAFGYEKVNFLQTADFWGDDAMEKFLRYAESDDMAKAPTSLQSRYITEDVSQGLVLLESIAQFAGVATPLVTSLITIASAALNLDFRKFGRTVQKTNATDYITNLYKSKRGWKKNCVT